MKLRQRLASSLRPLLANRVRTALALSGVAVGVAAVVVARAIGDGAQREMASAIEGLGTNVLVAKPLPMKRPVFRPQFSGSATTLTKGDFRAVAALADIGDAAPVVEAKVRLKYGTRAMKAALRGTTPQFLSVRRFAIAEGRTFGPDEDERAERVAVVGARVDRELGQGKSLVGRTVRIRGIPFEVVGVLQEKGTTPDGSNEDDQVLVPIGTAMRRVFNQSWLTGIYARVGDPINVPRTTAVIEALLRQRHGTGSGSDDFAVQSTSKVRAFQQEMTASFSRYATWLAGIALLIGGFGIMALMYSSVRERTSEIGLRIAVGAERRDILLQFLIEAAALAVAGWGVGCVLAGLGVLAVALGSSLPLVMPLPAVLLSLATAVVIGLGFGALPARTAATIPPIRALLKT